MAKNTAPKSTPKLIENVLATRLEGGPRLLADRLAAITKTALGPKGLNFAGLLSHWPQIMGPELAQKCLPVNLSFPKSKSRAAKLTLATTSAWALELSHQLPQLLERINAYFGYAAVAQIKLDHSLLTQSNMKIAGGAFRGGAGMAQRQAPAMVKEGAALGAVPSAAVCELYNNIDNADLRGALKSLCEAVAKEHAA